MALPLGKLTLIVGAGLVGSVLAKEGRISDVSDFVSGAFKIASRQLTQDDSTSSSSKSKNDSLMQQVNSLRQELQLLASNRSVTIVTGNQSSGSGKYSVVIIVVVVGYGYIWLKGWKLSDMMFATRRGLNDACSSVAKQLENVYSSLSATKKHLSSRIDHVDCKIDECIENTAATKDEVSELRGDVKFIGTDVQSVHEVVHSLATKISRIEGKQDETNIGVRKLLSYLWSVKNRTVEQIEGAGASSSRPALEMPPSSPSRVVSLPTNTLLEPPSPSTSSGSHEKQATFPPRNSSETVIAASGLKDLFGVSHDAVVSNPGTPASEYSNSNNSSGDRVLGRQCSNLGASLLTRSRSAALSFKL